MENVYIFLWPFAIFYGHLDYFMTIWYNLFSFGTFFSGFVIKYQEKSGNPALNYHATEKSEAIACARRYRSSRLTGRWTQKNNRKNGRRRGTRGCKLPNK
jgi:hypothetical protein